MASEPRLRRRPAIFIEATEETRWELRRAALDAHLTARRLAGQIVAEWLTRHGYLLPSPDTQADSESEA